MTDDVAMVTLWQRGDLFVEASSDGKVRVWRGGRDWGGGVIELTQDECQWVAARFEEVFP